MRLPSSRRLLAHSFLYEASLDWVNSFADEPDRRIRAIEIAARFARFHHAGRFADGALENWALQFGANHSLDGGARNMPLALKRRRRSSTLHVATEVLPVGGHTRFLLNWMVRDASADHALVLTDQRAAVPAFLAGAITTTGGALLSMPSQDTALSRAGTLRGLSTAFDRVVLHCHPHDPVPILAFAIPDGPPVAMFNHAHYDFNLGATVSDLVINTQPYYEQVSRLFRYARRTACLPGFIGLTSPTADPIDKEAAKTHLGFSPSARLMMTIGQPSFFTPISDYDFFRTAAGLLERMPDVHLLVVGVSLNQSPEALRADPRCHFIGPVVDPGPYYRAADVCLESFPRSSGGAVVESVVYGEARPVPMYGEGESILRIPNTPFLNGVSRPHDEEDYLDHVTKLLADLPSARQFSRQLRLGILRYDEHFDKRLEWMNDTIDALTHQPTQIPSCAMLDSHDSRTLAALSPSNRLIDLCGALPRAPAIRAGFRTTVRHVVRPFRGAALTAVSQYVSRTLEKARARDSKAIDQPYQ